MVYKYAFLVGLVVSGCTTMPIQREKCSVKLTVTIDSKENVNQFCRSQIGITRDDGSALQPTDIILGCHRAGIGANGESLSEIVSEPDEATLAHEMGHLIDSHCNTRVKI